MTFQELITAYPEHKEEAEERAAIKEYHFHVIRELAESQTVRLITWKYGIIEQEEMNYEDNGF